MHGTKDAVKARHELWRDMDQALSFRSHINVHIDTGSSDQYRRFLSLSLWWTVKRNRVSE